MTVPRAALALLAAASLPLAGCARGVAVESEPGPAYALVVQNPMPHPMIVSYDDGTGTRLLGTVAASGQAEFLIAGPARQTVAVIATDQGDTHTVRREVALRSDSAARVTLSP